MGHNGHRIDIQVRLLLVCAERNETDNADHAKNKCQSLHRSSTSPTYCT